MCMAASRSNSIRIENKRQVLRAIVHEFIRVTNQGARDSKLLHVYISGERDPVQSCYDPSS
jgi:hypothetical protein